MYGAGERGFAGRTARGEVYEEAADGNTGVADSRLEPRCSRVRRPTKFSANAV